MTHFGDRHRTDDGDFFFDLLERGRNLGHSDLDRFTRTKVPN